MRIYIQIAGAGKQQNKAELSFDTCLYSSAKHGRYPLINAESLLWNHSSDDTPCLVFPAVLQRQMFPIIHPHPSKTSVSLKASPAFQLIPQLQEGWKLCGRMQRMLSVGVGQLFAGKKTGFFFIITGLKDTQAPPFCQMANQM